MRWAMSDFTMLSVLRGLLILFVLLPGLDSVQAQTPDAATILASSDKARGGGLPGILWQVDVETAEKNGDKDSMRVVVKSNGDDNMMEILEPVKARGRKILMRGNNMWFSSPSVTKPVPISPRQRLTGQASYGDIAATNYVKDYSAVLLADELLETVPCYVLELTASSKSVTYDKVKYWIAQDTGLGIRAEFYTVSGKHIKTARFKYDNHINAGEKSIPFVSEMQIVDALAGDAVTTLNYSAIEVRSLSARDFRLN